MMPFRLEYVIERTLQTEKPAIGRREHRTNQVLSGVRLPERNACEVWSSIVERNRYLGEWLKRDLGLRAAGVDHLEKIAPPPQIRRGRRAAFSLIHDAAVDHEELSG
jgi:hypothetical protein